MNRMQILENLHRIINQIHNAMDEVDDIADNDVARNAALQYLMEAEMKVYHLIDEIDTDAVQVGEKSGAV